MEKKNFIWTASLGFILGIGTGLIGDFLKMNKKVKSLEKKSETVVKSNQKSNSLNYEETVKRLSKYSNEFASCYYKIHNNLGYSKLRPWKFPERYYLFCINTYGGDLGISIVSGTNQNGIISQKEVYEFIFTMDEYFNELDRDKIFPRFELLQSQPEKPKKTEEFKKEEIYGSSYSFGLAEWAGINRVFRDGGWYRSTTLEDWNTFGQSINIGKAGGVIEVRALVSETVFNKIRNLVQDNIEYYDVPSSYLLDQLDKIFEEELARPRTKQEIEG